MKLSGRIITCVGGLLLVVACFLHFNLDVTLWSGGPREALLLTLLAVGGVTLSIVSIFVDFPVLVGAQVGLAIYAFGEAFTIGSGGSFSGLQIGFWLASIATIGMVIGASLLAGAIWSARGWRPTTGFVGGGRSGPSHIQAQATNGSGSPPAGWYSDPSGQAPLRYWSGASWTDQVRS